MKKLKELIVKWKFRIGYFSGFLTTFAAIIILSNTLQDKLSLLHISMNYLVVLLIVFVIVVTGAYFLDRFGFIESEIDYSNSKNTVLKEIHGGKQDGSNNKDRT